MPQLSPDDLAKLKEVINVAGTNYYGGLSGYGSSNGTKMVTPPAPVKSTIPSFLDKVGRVVGQTADLGKELGTGVGKFVVHTAQDVYHQAYGAAQTYVQSQTQPIINKQLQNFSAQLDRKQAEVVADYKAGKISKDNYMKLMTAISKANQDLSKQAQAISQGPSPTQRASDVANTAVNILTLGSLSLEKAAAKDVVEQGVKGLVNSDSLTTLEKLVTRVPAARQLIERNAASTMKIAAGEDIGQLITRQGKNVLTGLLIKRPLFYQQNFNGVKQVYNELLSGNYDSAIKSSAWLGTQMIQGGPIGAVYGGAKWFKGKLGKLAYGQGSFIDELSKRIGDGNPAQIARFIATAKERAPGQYKDIEKTFRILQESNLQVADNNLKTAVDNVLTHYEQHGIDLSTLTPSQLFKDMNNWAEADQLAQKTLRAGLVEGIRTEEASKYVVVRWDTPTKAALAKAIKSAPADYGPQGLKTILHDFADRPGVGWGNNRLLMTRLEEAIDTSVTADEAAKKIKDISTAAAMVKGVPSEVAKRLESMGYAIAEPFGGRKNPVLTGIEDTRKLVSGALQRDNEIFNPAQTPQPELAAFAGAVDRLGLSPRATNDVANRVLGESLVANLNDLELGATMGLKDSQGGDLVNGGRVILSKLQQYIENKKPALGLGRSAAITDVRQLKLHEIMDALGVSKDEAKNVSHALLDAYTKIPMEFRGMGDKAVDYWYKINPLQKYYSRIQSAFRYTYNPFFRTQERVETKLLSHAQANNLVWQKSRQELNDAAKILDESGILNSSLPGEAAQNQVFGRITANITQGQKRDLAGLALDMAEKRGMSLQQLVNEHPDNVDDALRVVVQYGRKGVLVSPLMRTMSIAFFPMRYNFKVTKLAADVLGKQPPSVQLAVLHSMFKMGDWLKSDEGIKWQATHADALSVLNWLTPINSIEYTLNLLNGVDSIGELGQLGGLPFGIIGQLLDSSGVINLNRPYVTPDKGDVIPKNVPQNLKAGAATALTDLLGTMFTYPGRVLGLPGKQATMEKIVGDFISTNSKDFEKQYNLDNLTPLQQRWIKVLKGDTSKQSIDALYNSPAAGQFNWYTIPPLRLEIPQKGEVLTRTQVQEMRGSRGRAPKTKKKALAIPTQ